MIEKQISASLFYLGIAFFKEIFQVMSMSTSTEYFGQFHLRIQNSKTAGCPQAQSLVGFS